jgi:hypothetical protein
MLNETASRRHLLAASAAAPVSTAAVAAPMCTAQASVSSPDAELVAMASEWIKARKRLTELYEEWEIVPRNDPEINKFQAQLSDLEQRVARTKAHTIEGILSKARMAETNPIGLGGLQGDLEDVLTHPESTAQFIGLSLTLDILHMYGASMTPAELRPPALLCRKPD